MPDEGKPSGPHPGGGDQRLIDSVSGDVETLVGLTGQFYRGEVERMTAWRTRLDQTTNWAVVVMAAILTFAFSSSDNPHYVLLIGALGVGAFLIIESQRYQEYDAWRYRVRLLQRNLLAGMFSPDGTDGEGDWRRALGSDLRRPELVYPRWRALAHRLKRVYFLLLSILLIAWGLRISVFEADEVWQQTASIADVPGVIVVAGVATVYAALGGLALWSVFETHVREFGDPSIRNE